ncbi:uncharacterized protein DNG_02501 [Cephalotrichum gorgonifer]|uniref:Uncharacterized protein n=1 Tax=Cephalotrichum gorgonifer TaxID=2041049 RepID=A0AAE8SSQ6_9PEZI|nr:uncharacterized protein DNG_02501 [Cephalotrichum gorgonifer]
MLSTISLFIPSTVHSNLTRRLNPLLPPPPLQPSGTPGADRRGEFFPGSDPEWAERRPNSSSSSSSTSSATHSLPPGTPGLTPGGRRVRGEKRGWWSLSGGSGTPAESAYDERTAMIQDLRAGLLCEARMRDNEKGGYEYSSSIDWNSVRRGLTKISLAAEESTLPPSSRNPTFERAEYISGLSHLLASLPHDLSPGELSTLQQSSSVPAGLSTVLALLFLSAILLPHLLALARAAMRAERRFNISSNALEAAREAGRRLGGVPGKGVLFLSGLDWVYGSVVGGAVEGFEEGVEMLKARNRPS